MARAGLASLPAHVETYGSVDEAVSTVLYCCIYMLRVGMSVCWCRYFKDPNCSLWDIRPRHQGCRSFWSVVSISSPLSSPRIQKINYILNPTQTPVYIIFLPGMLARGKSLSSPVVLASSNAFFKAVFNDMIGFAHPSCRLPLLLR